MEASPKSIRSYTPKNPHCDFPYSARDFTRMDEEDDRAFYRPPRLVEHIDKNAISNLQSYYAENLPRKGRILDFCSSWISHFPSDIELAAKSGDLEILGTGMNEEELRRNPILKQWAVQDLNENSEVQIPGYTDPRLDASTCVVSIDYLVHPREVLSSIRRQTRPGGKIHLAISNRCFPTKAIRKWLEITEEERLDMVGDYLFFSGWSNIEIVTVVEGSFMKDPLWVVRASSE